MAHTSTFIEDQDEKVELFLSCRKLKNSSDTQIKIYIERKNQYALCDQTELIKDTQNPNFTKTCLLDYVFEVKQNMKFEVTNKGEILGIVQTTLGEIVGSKNMTQIQDIQNNGKACGKLIIRAEKVRENHSTLSMTVSGQNLKNTKGWFGKSNPVLKLSRMAGDNGFVLVYESEVVKKNLSPIWNAFELKIRKLCNGDYMRPIKAEVHSRSKGKDTMMGECQFTIDEITSQEKKNFTLFNPKKNKKGGVLRLDRFQLQEKPGFLDYLRGGSQLAVMVAIDFTSSNGDPVSLDSLHAFKYDGTLNEYQKAIMGVCDILLHYDADKKVPMFGFGGRPKFPHFTAPAVNHCFSLTGDQTNPWAYGLEGIMQVYLNALHNVELSGPTLFAPIMQTAMKIAQQNKIDGSVEYTILLILTDGEIHDMEQTINCLIKSAQLPLSVIIVGLGGADFTNMVILDGDDGLFNSDGVKAQRDLVQFVPFRDFQGSPELLAKHVLEEIPAQVVEYYTSMGITPRPAQNVDIANILRGTTMDDRGFEDRPPGPNNESQLFKKQPSNVEKILMAPPSQENAAHYSNISFFPGNKMYGQQEPAAQSPQGRRGSLPEQIHRVRKGSNTEIPETFSVDFVNLPLDTNNFERLNKFSTMKNIGGQNKL